MAFVAMALGGVSVLGWAPWAWWPIALLGYAGLFYLLSRERAPLRAMVTGLAFGVGLHAAGHGWVFGALHDKAGLGWTPAALGSACFVVYLALFTALPCGLFALLRTKQRPCTKQDKPVGALLLAASFASLIGAGDYARSLFFNGFTSLSLGYALVDTWLAAIGSVGGVFLVSWFALCCAALLVLALQGDGVCRFLAPCLVITIFAAGGYLSGLSWVEPFGSAVSYRLLQINEPQHRKFDTAHAHEQVLRTAELIERKRADLIVTPETAFPQFLTQLPQGVLARLRAFSLRTQSHLMLGIPTTAANSDGHNSVLHLAPAGPDKEGSISQYHKVRLMPFGEYSPWGFGWFTRHLSIPLKDLSAGAESQSPFWVGPQQAGILICDEDGLGDEARRWVGGEGAATILINPSNLAWFEGSLAIEQRLQMVRMRAIEVGRPILRVANTGVTAQGSSGLTPYANNGSAPFLSTLALSLLINAIYLLSRQRY